MAEELSDLTGGQEFNFDFHLNPLGDALELTGTLKAEIPMSCSFCSEDYNKSLQMDFKDYLVPTESQKQNKPSNKELELDPNDNEDNVGVENEYFYPAVYLRDKIGFEIPFQVPCMTKLEDCENYAYIEKSLNRHKAPDFEKENPFAGLKDLEVDKKR